MQGPEPSTERKRLMNLYCALLEEPGINIPNDIACMYNLAFVRKIIEIGRFLIVGM